jgi:uncharacterized protein with PQ loop repeat
LLEEVSEYKEHEFSVKRTKEADKISIRIDLFFIIEVLIFLIYNFLTEAQKISS